MMTGGGSQHSKSNSPMSRSYSNTILSKTPKMNFSKNRTQSTFMFGNMRKKTKWSTSSQLVPETATQSGYGKNAGYLQSNEALKMKSIGAAIDTNIDEL